MNPRYICEFPTCNYITYHKYIHYHHIIPKSKNGSNKHYNRVWLCPNHHCRIYIPGETNGIHAVCTEESVILISKRMTTCGILLEYRIPYSDEITVQYAHLRN